MTLLNNDLSIFTNKNENGIKLSDRLNSVLTNSKYFDVLVGYFRITGFYLLREKLENIEEIRILVGLGADIETVRVMDVFELSGANACKKLTNHIIEEFELTDDDNIEMENGVIKFCEWAKSGKLKIRMCYEKNVHAKLYIIRKNPDVIPDQFGNLITGSSNFTCNGLENNIEFNVELKDQANVKYALSFFDELWQESKDVTEDIVNTINKDTWMNKNITPYELFLKTLFVYFEEEIDSRKNDYPLPDGYMSLQYQSDAVTQARRILERHGGVIIADVVGLGKTYIASILGKQLDGRKLFIVPPVVKDSWDSVLSDFGYKMSDKVVSLGIVDQIAKWDDLASFKYVFVDEAHRFRNSSSTEFQYLKKICYGKGVILITATPQNNTILDIANLITLFQDSRNSSIIPGNSNIGNYFNELNNEIRKSDKDPKVVSRVAAEVRDNVLRHVMIRRTRSEITKYYKDDLDRQGLKFPKVHDPIRLDYMYDEEMDKTFNETIELLKGLSYAKYAPLLYLKNKKRIGSDKARQQNMIGFVKTMLVKRLESSLYAFLQSVKRLKKSSDGFISLYESGKVVVGAAKKRDYYDLKQMEDEAFQVFIDANDIDFYNSNEFEEEFIEKVKEDDRILQNIYKMWSKYVIDYSVENNDSKYDLLKEKIDSFDRKTKIIIFSEAKDTVDYLFNKLKLDYGDTVIDFSGDDSLSKKQYIQKNFDPHFGSSNVDDKRILVTTDSLSEGINLHKASIIINYDLPWNPTRVMQRVGRINRVGSKNSDLYVYNFFPRANTREHLSLEDSIKIKIQMFNELLGEDSKTITEDEEVNSYNLYDFLMMGDVSDEDSDFMSNAVQMSYIKMVNDIMQNNPTLADKIKSLPDKIRVAKNHENDSVITFIKQGWIKKFIEYKDGISEEIEFEDAAEKMSAIETDRNVDIPKNYFEALNSNKIKYDEMIQDSQGANVIETSSPSEKKVKKILMALIRQNTINASDHEYLIKVESALTRGSLNSRVIKDVQKKLEKNSNSIVGMIDAFKSTIDEVYLVERENYDVRDSLNKPKTVVLSECFVKKGF